jgi:hypothetical protein
MNTMSSAARAVAPELPDENPRFRGRHPAVLTFGTSGLRGLVTDITDLEAYPRHQTQPAATG